MNYADLHRQLFGSFAPSGIAGGESRADVVCEGRGFVDHFDLTLQLNVGCRAGCLFCYVPNNPWLAPPSVRGRAGELWGSVVKQKWHALERWRRHLQSGACADKVVYWSGVTDPYATPANETRSVWSALLETPPRLRPRRMIVQTRFAPERDAEMMSEYAASTVCADGGPPVVFSISIGTDRDDLIRAWERATPGFERRMKSVFALCQKSLFVVVTLSPFALWNDLAGTMRRLNAAGVAYVTILFFKHSCQGARTPTLFLDYLRKNYPQVLDVEWQAERQLEVEAVFDRNRVLAGKEAFASLARPYCNTLGRKQEEFSRKISVRIDSK